MKIDPSRFILAAPLIFVLHVIEEAPAFVDWFNSLVKADPINQQMFINVNVWGFFITLVITALFAAARERVTAHIALCWLSAIMLANAIFHIAGTVALKRYAPGVVTATLLYLPFFSWFLFLTLKRYQLSRMLTAVVIAVGAAPMLWHGYRIVFEGRRLF